MSEKGNIISCLEDTLKKLLEVDKMSLDGKIQTELEAITETLLKHIENLKNEIR